MPPIPEALTTEEGFVPITQTASSLHAASILSKPIMQCGGEIKVNMKMLLLNDQQHNKIQGRYEACTHFHQLFDNDLSSQQAATDILRDQGLVLENLDDLGNGWSKRWSTCEGTGPKQYVRALMQWYEYMASL
ncbi:hypothetical protein K439DRAFT_1618969 [Ramaria rubella]|nr:hypothetical protein K439DRAFT_1618969 [Ramaria rubella]